MPMVWCETLNGPVSFHFTSQQSTKKVGITMSDPNALDAANDTIPHQTAVEGVIDDTIEASGGVGYDNAHIADASVAHALNATFSDTEVEAALNALGTK